MSAIPTLLPTNRLLRIGNVREKFGAQVRPRTSWLDEQRICCLITGAFRMLAMRYEKWDGRVPHKTTPYSIVLCMCVNAVYILLYRGVPPVWNLETASSLNWPRPSTIARLEFNGGGYLLKTAFDLLPTPCATNVHHYFGEYISS